MTKNETLTILALLNAFYAGGKNDPKQQTEAWHMILHKYDYESARMAVLNFAENDTRDYATFPAVGLIVNEIRKTEKSKTDAISEIVMGVSYGRPYDMLHEKAKELIRESTYNEWLGMDAELFSAKTGALTQILKQKQKQIESK